MTFHLNKLFKTKFIFFCAFIIVFTQQAVLAQNLEKPYTFSQGATASSKQINTNFDLLYEAINPLLARVEQPEVTKTYTMLAGQPANADHINTNFDELYTAVNYLLAGFHLTEITKPFHFTNGEQSNPDHVNQNFDVLFTSINQILPTNTRIPDTGQTLCYNGSSYSPIDCPDPNEILAQDGSYIINPPSYTDNGDGTVTDEVTGLIWQQTNDGLKRNWNDAINYCSNNVPNLPGDEWRLPTIHELAQIADHSQYPLVHSSFLLATADDPAHFWSSTPASNSSDGSYIFGFSSNYLLAPQITESFFVLCTKGPSSKTNRLYDNHNGTILDLSSGLVWQNTFYSGGDWRTALQVCENLDFGGSQDWRLPNIKELQSIVDYSRHNPVIDRSFFPNTQQINFWSSTPNSALTGGTTNVLSISFYDGTVNRMQASSSGLHFRCVRNE